MESTEQKIKNKEAVDQESTEQKIINKEAVDQESSQEIKQEPIKYTQPKPQFNFRKKKKFNFAFLFDPTNKIWLNFVLIFFFILEGIVLVSAIILSIVYSSLLYFLYSIIGIVVLHVLTMIGFNMIFNIQAIKDDIKELKNKR